MRIALLLVECLLFAEAVAQPAAGTPPTPPADPCGRAAFRELQQLGTRIRALAAAGLPTQDDIVGLVMDAPTGYVAQSPGRERILELFATTDARISRKLLGEIEADLAGMLGNDRMWAYRCEAYPSWYLAPPALRAKDRAERRAVAKRTKAALARAEECTSLSGRVLAAPDHERRRFSSKLYDCYRDLNAARTRCERDLSSIARTDGYGPFRAQTAVSNLLGLRRKRAPAPGDIVALRRRIVPMLDALPPPLSELSAPTRIALTRTDPMEALFELSVTLTTLVGPCARLWPSTPRCIISPQSCEPTID